jgi:hypothetical protein
VNNTFDEPARPGLDSSAIIGKGARFRRRRRAGQVAAAVLAVACIAAGVLLVRATASAVASGASTNFTLISS